MYIFYCMLAIMTLFNQDIPPIPFSIAKRQGNLSLPLNRELVEKGQ